LAERRKSVPKKEFVLPSFMTEQAAIAQIIKLLDESRAPTYMHTFEHFNRALAIWESVLRQDPMPAWLEACRGLEFGLDPLAKALTILIDQAQSNYHDILGSVYMALGQGDKRFGQYFTPYPVAQMMAEMCLGDFKLPEPGQPPIRFCEPTVGSGIMILAAAEVIERRFPGAIGRGEVEFYGMDKDPCCISMCRLNMKLHSIGHVVQRIEDLTEGQRRLLERLLGRRLPRAGVLVDDPTLQVGDTLLQQVVRDQPVKMPSQQERNQPDLSEGAQPEVSEQLGVLAEEPDEIIQVQEPELIEIPTLVAQDLFAGLEQGTANGKADRPEKAQAGSNGVRRRGARGAKQRDARYTSAPLFGEDLSQ
jgi:N-6 DNA Methylase